MCVFAMYDFAIDVFPTCTAIVLGLAAVVPAVVPARYWQLVRTTSGLGHYYYLDLEKHKLRIMLWRPGLFVFESSL